MTRRMLKRKILSVRKMIFPDDPLMSPFQSLSFEPFLLSVLNNNSSNENHKKRPEREGEQRREERREGEGERPEREGEQRREESRDRAFSSFLQSDDVDSEVLRFCTAGV